jgi:catechol 2,3-dioxygenase-like lactoylglutathione lyase family enzyme
MADIVLNLVVIRAADLERSKRFYETLGLVLVKERHGNGPEHYSCQVGGMAFEIYPIPHRTEAALHRAEAGVLPRLGFRVPSVDRALGALTAVGARVVSEPARSPWGRRAVVSDPDGHRVEITEAGSNDSGLSPNTR